MSGISVKLPLALDENDGIKLNKSLLEVTRQNFINLLLTNPGERIMIPSFGVGLEGFLFENNNATTRQEIDARIRAQVRRFLSYIKIRSIQFNNLENINRVIERNSLSIRIIYEIVPLSFIDNLAISPDLEEKLINIETVVDGQIISLN